jgi:hypothetical protein
MSVNVELLVRTGQFLDDHSAFAELVEWIQDREEYWAGLPADSMARVLADTIMLAAYEVDDGIRDVASVKDLLSDAMLQPAHG